MISALKKVPAIHRRSTEQRYINRNLPMLSKISLGPNALLRKIPSAVIHRQFSSNVVSQTSELDVTGIRISPEYGISRQTSAV
jgi:hypothetical protein